MEKKQLWMEVVPVTALRNVMATQKNRLWVNSHKYSQSKSELCRRCHKAYETKMHIVTECPANMNLIKERHGNICEIIHRLISKKMKINYDIKNLYERPPAEIKKDDKSIIYDLPLPTGGVELSYNRPDMLHIEKNKKKGAIIEVCVTWISRLNIQYLWKVYKYATNSKDKIDDLKKNRKKW
uniref:Reverse transcriptase zinc-binding domain-containing protein n=1 Tax=Strongyloides stercoralis TaxID=6248 RepID=A0A0K0EC39_STRER